MTVKECNLSIAPALPFSMTAKSKKHYCEMHRNLTLFLKQRCNEHERSVIKNLLVTTDFTLKKETIKVGIIPTIY